MKRLFLCLDVTAFPGAADLCAAFTITVANGEMNLFIFYSLDLLFCFACFDIENSIFYLYFFPFVKCGRHLF